MACFWRQDKFKTFFFSQFTKYTYNFRSIYIHIYMLQRVGRGGVGWGAGWGGRVNEMDDASCAMDKTTKNTTTTQLGDAWSTAPCADEQATVHLRPITLHQHVQCLARYRTRSNSHAACRWRVATRNGGSQGVGAKQALRLTAALYRNTALRESKRDVKSGSSAVRANAPLDPSITKRSRRSRGYNSVVLDARQRGVHT